MSVNFFRGNWATSLIAYRDDLSHYQDLDGFVHMHVPLYKKTPWYKENEISGPFMPHGEPIEVYCKIIVSQLADFIRETIVLLPSVDQKLISVDKFLKE